MKQIMASKMGEPLEGSIASRRSEAPPSQAKLLEAQAKILALGKKLLDVKKGQPGGETQESQEIEMRREAERRRLGQGSLLASLTQDVEPKEEPPDVKPRRTTLKPKPKQLLKPNEEPPDVKPRKTILKPKPKQLGLPPKAMPRPK